jgi:membrane protease YdiL (CAAX protease family)
MSSDRETGAQPPAAPPPFAAGPQPGAVSPAGPLPPYALSDGGPPIQPPPTPPELPEGAAPRWPAWYAAAGFGAGLFGTLIAVGIIAAVLGTDPDENDVTVTIVATLIQSAVFIATAVLFASFVQKPRPWHFGLRRTRLWPAIGWAALGMVSFYVFAAVYTVLVDPSAEQTVAEDLGAGDGGFGLALAGFMIICIAPAAEEFFFRGFFYRALRSKYTWLIAALIDGVLFGAIHWDGSADGLLILPPLAVLGFMFCVVFERTGSIFPVIALHSINNSIAFAAQADGGAVSAVLGPLMIVVCIVVPSLMRPAPAPRGV